MKQLINQLFELEQRVTEDSQGRGYERIFSNIKNSLEEMGYTWHNPMGEKYAETRTDCEASISGRISDKMIINQVIKPVIYKQEEGTRMLVQKAIVIVEGK